MATSLTVRRVCCSAARLLPRVEPRQPFHTQSKHLPYLHHHHHPSSPALLSGVTCALRAGNRSATSFHICQRSFFTKWFSASGSSSSPSSKARDNAPPSKDADGRVELQQEEEEEESIIPKTDEQGQPLSNWKRMKVMMKAYGYVIIPVHWVIAPLWFGAFYYTIKLGVDIGPFLKTVGVSDHHVETLRNSKASTALMAYALYKIFTPLRYTVTLGATEVTIRRLRKMGYMRPTPPKEKSYRDSFKETVGEMKDKITDMRETKNS